MAHAAGSIGAHIVRSILTQRTFRLVGWLLLGTLVVATGYLLWAHERWVDFPDYLDDPLYPRSFPFPDQILGKYEAWLDMRNPPAPNQFKIHGEIYTVMEHLRGLIFACVMMAFFLSGLLLPKLSTKLRHMVKMSFRHERIPD
jgi:hypothetical protein